MRSEVARLHAQYLSASLTPVSVVERHLALAREVGGRLSAFTLLAADGARAAAAASAARYARGEPRSVLDGVPVVVKDLLHVRGLPTTCGSRASDPRPATSDAEAVARLRSLGAAVVGKTTLSEYGLGTLHPEVPPARNPWAPDREEARAPAGSAAAVAAGIGFLALTTDTLGAARAAAAAFGAVALKPGHGALPMAGVVPVAPTLDHLALLTRTVDDARLAYEALTGSTARGAGDRPLRLGVAWPEGTGEGVRQVVERILAELGREGVEIVPVEPLPWREANAAAWTIAAAEALEVHGPRLAGRWAEYGPALRRRLVAGAVVSAADYVRARRVRGALVERWHALLRHEAVDAVATPTLGSPRADAPAPQGRRLVPERTRTTALYALLGVPALTLPAGLGPDGLPVGVQFAAGAGREGMVLDVAARAERVRGVLPRPPAGADPFAPPAA